MAETVGSGDLTNARKIYVATDGSSDAHCMWAVRNLLGPEDELHLLTVLPPLSYSITPSVPMATAGAVAAVTQNWEHQKKQDEDYCRRILLDATRMVTDAGVPLDRVHTHMLPAAGGASGVAASIVEYVNTKGAHILVLGSRGMGSLKRSMMSLLGMGSVSDYCVHNGRVPIAVVHSSQDAGAAEDTNGHPNNARKVCIAVDDSDQSQEMMRWACRNLVRPDDECHLITVALPAPYPMVDEQSPAAAALEAQRWHQQQADAARYAEAHCKKAVAAAQECGVARDRLWYKALEPEGGASDVGESICHYVKQNKVDMLVLASRGMGSFKSSVMSFIGLGSVGDHCVHNASCPVVIKKAAPSKPENGNRAAHAHEG